MERENKNGVARSVPWEHGPDFGDVAAAVTKANGAFDHPTWNDPYRSQTAFFVVMAVVTAVAAFFGTYWLPRSTDMDVFVGGLGIALPTVLVVGYVTLLVLAVFD
jgi:hypothetical protein